MGEVSAFSLKTILVGSSGVGKTCLVRAYYKRSQPLETTSTVAPASCTATLTTKVGTLVELHIWDTAGQERFQSLSQMFYRQAQIAFVCFDNDTFEDVACWIERVRSVVPNCIVFLVRTKSDLMTEEEIRNIVQHGAEFNDDHSCNGFFVTSSSTGNGVADLFMAAADCADIVYKENKFTKVQEPVPSDGKGCC